ncbi:MAG TPA: RNA 2',3'-cyclic phosphodiesterase [Jiangellaceae bacterium]
MRLFAAAVPPASVVDHLTLAVDPVRASDAASGEPLTWAAVDGWHITLAFYGEVHDASVAELTERLARAAARYEPIEVRVTGAGRFSRAVLWAGVRGDVARLSRLAASTAAAGRRAGVTVDEYRTYRPHLTLARSSRQADLRPYVRDLAEYDGPRWTIDQVALVRSHLGGGEGRRARYETVATFPMKQVTTAPRPPR